MVKSSILLILTVFSFHAVAQMSKSEMMSKIDSDQITFERAPLVKVQEQVRDKALEKWHALYPRFKDSMWYYAYVQESGYTEAIHYDWVADQCLYIVINNSGLAKRDPAIGEFMKSQGKQGSDAARKEVIPVKYCEKIYNFYSK